jgi:hypothetical protein
MRLVALASAVLLAPVPAARSQNVNQILKELVSPLPEVADADNGWLAARNLSPKVVREETRRKPLTILPGDERTGESPGVDREVLKEYQRDNAALIAEGRKILALPVWLRPRPEGLLTGSLLTLDESRLALPMNIIVAEAIVQAQDGHLDKAWPDILAVAKLGRRMMESGGTVLDSLVGATLLSNAVRTAAWIGEKTPDAATARRLAADLAPFEEQGNIYQRTLEGEFVYILKRCEIFQAGGEALKHTLVEWHVAMDGLNFMMEHFNKWGKSIEGKTIGRNDKLPELKMPEYPQEANMAKWMKDPPQEVLRQIESAKEVDWAEGMRLVTEQFKKARLIKPTTWADFKKAARPERDQDKKASSEKTMDLDGSCQVIQSVIFRATTAARLARTSLLLRAWKHEHNGELPESLEALVPGYLPVVPVDPYDGKPLRFDRKKLRSVGPNLKDDGGNSDDRSQAL